MCRTSAKGVTLTVAEAPLVEVGEMHSELPSPRNVGWKTYQRSSPWLSSYVMNNYWHTNYKADQEGVSSYRYSILPHGLFNQEQGDPVRYRAEPATDRPAGNGRDAEALTPSSSVTPGKIIATYVKPLSGGTAVWSACSMQAESPETATLHVRRRKTGRPMGATRSRNGEKRSPRSLSPRMASRPYGLRKTRE